MVTFDRNNKKSFKIILSHLNILYIEDEKEIRENITKTLSLVVFKVFSVENISLAWDILNKNRIDLIISDINLGDESGINFIKKLRKINSYIPVILLSAYTDKGYLLEATKLKLVDYLVKPIDFNILNNALLNATSDLVENGKFIVDFLNGVSYNVMQKKLYLRANNKEINLTAKEIELLEYLIENHTRVISHDEIKTYIWDDDFEATDSALKNVLNKLRKKIGKESIKNISGIGFRIYFS